MVDVDKKKTTQHKKYTLLLCVFLEHSGGLFLPLDGPRDEEPTGQGARAGAEDGEPSLVHVHLGHVNEPRRVGVQEFLRWLMTGCNSVVRRVG